MKQFTLLFTLMLCSHFLLAQQPLTYYLPDVAYNPDIPTPEEVFGFQIGEWHLSHDKQYSYMKQLAAASDRIELKEFAYTYEGRPLVYLLITSPKNHANLAQIKAQHVQLTDPSNSKNLNVATMPAVVYQGFSIHGNESSGANAAPLVAYYLAAAQTQEVQDLLDNVVVLLDPAFNPDGMQRFSTWVNSYKGVNVLTTDPQSQEYNEPWPRGRTNHYWFDLNRDWLPLQHPESQGRIANFHEWKPNILTDHHEMGSNGTFFFQPGVPARTNPLTPKKNQELTGKIAEFHAAALDKIGSFYYTKESFDDFYYGKGSTYPDINGGIGILFEQASSRGHVQETANGLLTFAFTIRNQVVTALSTLKAAYALREELLTFQRDFYTSAMQEAGRDALKGYVFSERYDKAKLAEFLKILRQHQVKVHQLGKNTTIDGTNFEAEHSYLVPLAQPQYRLIKAMFEKVTTFQDSLFYDVSAWTLPLAFNLDYKAVQGNLSSDMLGKEVQEITLKNQELPAFSNYGYLLDWDGYFAPKALYAIQNRGLRTKMNVAPFTLADKEYQKGRILIPVQNQNHTASEIHTLMQQLAQETGVTISGISTGMASAGIDLGSPSFVSLRQPNVLLIIGDGVSSYDAGEVWHLLDQRYNIPVSMIKTSDLGYANLDRYNVIVMANGSYGPISSGSADKIKSWVQAGGTLVAMEGANRWVKSRGLAFIDFKDTDRAEQAGLRRPYDKLDPDEGVDVIGGAIFQTEMDGTHPLAFGYNSKNLPFFRSSTLLFKPTRNPYAAPFVYTHDPLLSGYISKYNLEMIKDTPAVVVSGTGRGRVICIADNPNFRAFWYGGNKLFANALFFGNTISSGALERAARMNNQADSGE